MGKGNKKEQEAQLKAYREAAAKKEAEERVWQNRKIGIICGVFFAVAAIAILLTLWLTGCFSPKQPDEPAEPQETEESVIPFEDLVDLDSVEEYFRSEEKTDYVCMKISYTDKDGNAKSGRLVLGLDKKSAPISAAHFQDLVADGYYNGLTFRRVYPGFMIQGGFPGETNDGSSASSIVGEFFSNGIKNPISHTRGVLSWARRSDDMNSASGQFFIVHQNSTYLDGNYAGFGIVLAGMDLVDEICNIDLLMNGEAKATLPVYPVTIEEAYFVMPSAANDPFVD